MSRPDSAVLGSATHPALLFAALGDPTRLFLLRRLSAGQTLSIAKLAVDTEVTRQAVTKHLRTLEQAGLVRRERVGRESLFRFNPEPIADARDYLNAVSAQWDDALDRLRNFLED